MNNLRNPILWLLICVTSCCAVAYSKAKGETFADASNDPEFQHCLTFLTTNMELPDRLIIRQEQLGELVSVSLRARRTFSWCARVPAEIFLRYSLPYRLAQEPFKPHRAWFADQLGPLVRETRTIQEAAAVVQLWCIAHVSYFPTAAWDLSPIDVLSFGGGRCEELCILFTAAARSVGIPVRQCFAPAWRDQDDNHFWVEIWTPEGWFPLSAAETVIDPKSVWFTKQARVAASVLSATPGTASDDDAHVMRTGEFYTYLNLTSRYADTGRLLLTVETSTGRAIPNISVTAWSVNGLIPTAVAATMTDTLGKAELEVGNGTYLITICNAEANGKVEEAIGVAQTGIPLVMRYGPPSHIPQKILIDNPLPGVAKSFPLLEKDVRQLFLTELETTLRKRVERKCESEGLLAAVPAPGLEEAELIRHLYAHPQLLMKVRKIGTNDAAQAHLLLRMDPKDILLVEENALSQHLAAAQSARIGWGFTGGLSYSDEIFYRYVASPRILSEPFSLPGEAVRTQARTLREEDVSTTIARVLDWTEALQERPVGILTPDMTPEQILAAHCVTSQRDRAVITLTLLRLNGIPCRVDGSGYLMEAFTGALWTPLYRTCGKARQISRFDSLFWLHEGRLIPLADNASVSRSLPCGTILRVAAQRISPTETQLALKVLHE